LVGINGAEHECCSVCPNTNSIRMIMHGALEHVTRNTEDLLACFREKMVK